VLIEEGQRVETGQIVARLDDTNARAQLLQAEALLAQQHAALAAATVALRDAEPGYERNREQFRRGFVSAQQLDAVKTAFDSTSASVDVAARAVEVAAANVTLAQRALDDTVVRAPFAGIVTVKAAQEGEMVSPMSAGGGFTRTGIGTIVDMDSLEIEVDVNEAYINRVQPGQPVQSVLNAYPDWQIPSHVIAIIPTADRSKATVKVRIGLDLKDPRIVPDMGVRVSFLEERKTEAPVAVQAPRGALVPTGAIRTQDGHDVVYLLHEKRAEQRTVALGATRGDSRQVLSGVSIGDTVILDPPADLKDGAAVTVAK
jgi:RND family efflux transporter MFP subunit